MNKKGFLLVDSLISVLIVSSTAIMSFGVFRNVKNYYEGYDNYQKEVAENYESIFSELTKCEKCVIEAEEEKEDSYLLEP